MDTDYDYNKKVLRVFQKLLEPDFKIKNDVYLNSLLTYLVGNPETGCNLNWDILNKQCIPEWLIEAVFLWEKTSIPSPNIISFTLNITSFVCKNEQTFVLLNSNNIYERLIKLIRITDPATPPTIKLGYIKLISTLLEHKSGLQWIIATNYWADIMCLTLHNQTIYITREGYKFMAQLLEKSVKINEMFCLNVVQLIMAPLGECAPCMPQTNIDIMEVRDQAIYQSLCSTLSLIYEIIEIFLKNISEINNMTVIHMFKDKFHLEGQIRNLLLLARNEEFIFDLHRIMYIMGFLHLVEKFAGKSKFMDHEKAVIHGEFIFNVLIESITKGLVRNVLKLTYIGYHHWRNISDIMPICLKYGGSAPLPVIFEQQMLMLQLYPIIAVSFKIIGLKECMKVLEEDEIRDQYVDKIFKVTSPLTLRIIFKWRSCLVANALIFDNASLSLSYLIKSRQFFTRELATTAWQTLIYCLRDIINLLKTNPEQILVLSKEYNYMALLMDAITVFINEFNFTWTDSLESICVTNMSFDFLSIPTWPSKLVVKGLKLMDISISKYMSANMALLMDNVADSTLALIGPMLYAKLHDGSWEVRDTALEVLCTISNNANTKFPSFRKIVLEAELTGLVLKMATKDGESFVRATALKCLQEMAQVEQFWCSLLENGNVQECAMQILQKESEGIVRKEAATLIATIYEYQDVPSAVLGKFYDIMTHAAIADLHWEVKVNALKFWDKVINRHLIHQGMIDGTFPTVTFSKEHRKIVNLNEPEVRKRLIKVLNQLSETGCLAVLITALQDDCDMEVSKTAWNITKDFIELLKKYNVDSKSSVNFSNPPSPLTPFSGAPSPPFSARVSSISGDSQYQTMSPLSQLSQNSQGQMSPLSQLSQSSQNNSPMDEHEDMTDTILDEIINAQDVNLLQGVYNPSDQLCDNYLQLRGKKIVLPNDFLRFTFADIESRAKDKAKWLNDMDNFASLLDDILMDYENNDVNGMDCY